MQKVKAVYIKKKRRRRRSNIIDPMVLYLIKFTIKKINLMKIVINYFKKKWELPTLKKYKS